MVRFRVGDFVFGLWRVVKGYERRQRLEKWLEDNKVIKAHYSVICPNCNEGIMTKFMTDEERKYLEKVFLQFKLDHDSEAFEFLNNQMDYVCIDCEECVDFNDINKLEFNMRYKMMMERDRSLDNV